MINAFNMTYLNSFPLVIHMLILTMLLFFISWAPILTFNLLASFELLGADNMGTSNTTKHIKTASASSHTQIGSNYCKLLPAMHNIVFSCLNPLIYGFMSINFRQSFLTSFIMKNCCK